jgi:lipopolysaccharide transport system permease protein
MKTLVIEAGSTEKHYWGDLWRYRELFYFLAWRDLLVRYKQTIFGFGWALLRPLITMIVFTFVFGGLAKLPANGAPYPILVFSALLPWLFFSSAISSAADSLIGNANIISKIYFPRLVMPASSVIVCFVDFAISFLILLCLMVWYQFIPTYKIFFLPVFIFLVLFLSMGFGILIAALNVKYRDFRYIIPFVVQLGLYISPVGFSSSIVPQNFRLLYSVNPMVGVIDGFRWAILDNSEQFYWQGFLLSLLMAILIFFVGLFYFRKTEKSFADLV